MSNEPYSVVSLFDTLSERGGQYNYPELRSCVQELLREHARSFPPRYTVNEAIEWALRNEYLRVEQGETVVVAPPPLVDRGTATR